MGNSHDPENYSETIIYLPKGLHKDIKVLAAKAAKYKNELLVEIIQAYRDAHAEEL